MQTVKVARRPVQKIEWKQMDIWMDGVDCINFLTSVGPCRIRCFELHFIPKTSIMHHKRILNHILSGCVQLIRYSVVGSSVASLKDHRFLYCTPQLLTAFGSCS